MYDKCEALLREILKIERGDRCQICGRTADNIGLFHILPKGSHSKLRLYKANLLLACWLPCHSTWHHEYKKAKHIEKRIKEICGENYEEELLKLEAMVPKQGLVYLSMIHAGLKQELEDLRNRV